MLTKNERAFLDMIAYAELGPEMLKESDNGYNVVVGSTPSSLLLLLDYTDHPRILVKKVESTAAGHYQILMRIYDYYKKSLNLKDFSPNSQDIIAMQLIRECKAIEDIDAGRISLAISKCRSRWASLPGAGYGQREHRLEDLIAIFQKSGGTVSEP